MNGSDNEVLVGTGKSPEGKAVSYYEIDRPSTIGAPGSTGYLVEARGADGKRITHSDSLDGLKKSGYSVDEAAPAVVEVESNAPHAPEPEVEVDPLEGV